MPAIPITEITVLPEPPSTTSPSDFDSKADAFLGAFPVLRSEINLVTSNTYANTLDAKASADSAAIAATAAGATKWATGSYNQFAVVWSPITYLAYRKITATGNTTLDPSTDSTNWVNVSPLTLSSAASTYIPLTGVLGTSGVTLGTNGFRITNGYFLGLGTDAPNTLLQLNSATNANVRVSFSTTGSGSTTAAGARGSYVGLSSTAGQLDLWNYETQAIRFGIAGTEAMRVHSTGNVGLGTTDPQTKLHVYSGSSVTALTLTRSYDVAGSGGTPGAASVLLNMGALNGTTPTTAAQVVGTLNNPATTGYLHFSTLSTVGGLTEKMRIDQDGNVGVGTTSGGGKLEVAGSYVSFLDATRTNFLSISPGASSVINANSVMQFNTGGQERMRIDSSGNVLIGTTGTGPLNSNSITLGPTTTGGADFNHVNGTATGTMYSRFNLNAVTIGSIAQSGTTAVLYNTTSDARLKTNVQPATDAGTLLDAVQVRQFNWLVDGSHQRYGFVAQELANVVPEAVYQPVDSEEMMSVDYSKLVPLLVKEIQSLRARVATLEL